MDKGTFRTSLVGEAPMMRYSMVVRGLMFFAVVCLVGVGNVTPAYAETDLERYDAMNITPMPEEFADGLRGEWSAAGVAIKAAAGWIANTTAKVIGSDRRYTWGSPLKACAPAPGKESDC